MKSLFFICLLSVIVGTGGRVLRQYLYVPQQMNWFSAQNYCRHYYWDLAVITSQAENQRVKEANRQNTNFWIGLNRTEPLAETWQWSGGEETNFTSWNPGEPNNYLNKENCAVMGFNQWDDQDCNIARASVCYRRVTYVEENKTWEEALQHCRTHYSYLVTVDSQTLKNLLETEHNQPASVWTGLHFFAREWLWVNGVPTGSLVSLPQCPIPPYHCGAFNLNTYIWENRNCNEKLNFLCFD